jgi:hypothetical protein
VMNALNAVGVEDPDFANWMLKTGGLFVPRMFKNVLAATEGDVGNEWQLAGASPIIFNPAKNLAQEGGAAYNRTISEARKELASNLLARKNISDEEIEKHYLEYLKTEAKANERLHEVWKGTLNGSSLTVFPALAVLKEAGVGKEALSGLLNGTWTARGFGPEFGEQVISDLKTERPNAYGEHLKAQERVNNLRTKLALLQSKYLFDAAPKAKNKE